MIKVSVVLMFLLAVSVAQADTNKPNAGLEKRPIKALSEKDTQGYLDGAGMGLSFAAEMNHYPGPKHVLEHADQLGLDDKQVAAAKELIEAMKKDARQLGQRIVEKERKLDRMFALETVDHEALEAILTEIAELKGKLRLVHLRAHLSMRNFLSEKQIMDYEMLRGYGQNTGGHGQEHQSK